ncbi:MAG: hypothetical protein IH996_05225 [Proteobacteria bacterium]|nr:hypothetical protein [Pseudomonadota bacterium]
MTYQYAKPFHLLVAKRRFVFQGLEETTQPPVSAATVFARLQTARGAI